MKREFCFAFCFALALLVARAMPVLGDDLGLPGDKVALRYRIEFMDDNVWKPVKDTKKFKKDQTIHFRFMGNTAGTLYILNTSLDDVSLQPIFSEGSGQGLRKFLGLGTHIDANQVGIFPDPGKGGGLRFTGLKGQKSKTERFLFVFVPDDLGGTRGMMAIPAGAENWQFDDKATQVVTGDPGSILFHYFELKSK